MLGAKEPLVTRPIGSTVPADDVAALAGRRAALKAQTDTAASGSVAQFALNTVRAGKSAFVAAAFSDRPDKIRLHGGCGLVDVVAVEAEARFQAERVAGAQANRLHQRMGEQRARQIFGPVGDDGNLEAVLAGIARPADMAGDAVEFGAGRCHECEFAGFRAMAGQDARRRRTLQRQKRAIRPTGRASRPAADAPQCAR